MTTENLRLCSSPLSSGEAARLEEEMIPLLRFLGSPGDWGYNSKLGHLTLLLYEIRKEVAETRSASKVVPESNHEAPAMWSRVRVEKFALESNHGTLHCAIELYRHRGITWEQAMQVAAIEQAKALSASNNMLANYMLRYGALS